MSAQTQRLARRLAAIPKSVKKAVEPALRQSGEELVSSMRNLAPKDTHALEQSIKYTMPGNSTPAYSQPGGSTVAGENQVLVTAGNTDVRYPHLVEYGTAEAAAQPFFWPAYRLKKKRLSSRIKRAIGKAVKDEWRK
jgi:HK97 gp10 family phage protein